MLRSIYQLTTHPHCIHSMPPTILHFKETKGEMCRCAVQRTHCHSMHDSLVFFFCFFCFRYLLLNLLLASGIETYFEIIYQTMIIIIDITHIHSMIMDGWWLMVLIQIWIIIFVFKQKFRWCVVCKRCRDAKMWDVTQFFFFFCTTNAKH